VAPEGDAYALPVTEIRPVSSAFFDYHAKYTAGASNEITPAEISPELTARVQEIAELAHLAVGCSIWSRSDFIIDEGGPVWIEINIVPGLTPLSLYPQAAAAAGIAYPELMDMFVEAAIARAGKKA
jgi:D-alanine-D-alanine ligase